MNVFAYGTLMIPEIFTKVTGRNGAPGKAVLHDYARYRLIGAAYPAIIPQKGSRTDGRLYTDLDSEAMGRLDAFEGALYQRVEVTVFTKARLAMPAHAYVLRNAFRHRLTDIPWHLEEFRRNDQEDFVRSFSGFALCADKTRNIQD